MEVLIKKGIPLSKELHDYIRGISFLTLTLAAPILGYLAAGAGMYIAKRVGEELKKRGYLK